MSRFEIKMPKLGESITEGTIMRWAVNVGDTIKEDDVLFEVSTQKVNAEIPSPVAGKIMEIRFNVGDTVAVGTVLALVDMGGENSEPDDTKPETTPPATPEKPVEKSAEKIKSGQLSAAKTIPDKTGKEDESQWLSPVVLQLAQEARLSQEELASIKGTGYLGRISKKDVEDYIFQKNEKKPATAVASESVPAKEKNDSFVTPATSSIRESDEVKEMDPIRRIIAERMVQSKHTSAHVTTIVEVDVTKLVQWRDKLKDEFFQREGIKLTFMPAIIQAAAKALADFPQVNASVDGYKMIFKKNINIGIAVALPNWNLIVPVIHHADQLSLTGLALVTDSLANKARNNKLTPKDIDGGTFTITNFGTFKNIIGTPIINQPQVAILGVGYVEKKPAVVETPEGDVIAIRHKMYLSLSYDHRIVDGALGGSFLRRIADYLEDWKG